MNKDFEAQIGALEQFVRWLGFTGKTADWVAIGLILIGISIASHLLRFIFSSLLRRITSRTATTLDDKIIDTTRPSLLAILYLLGGMYLSLYLELRHDWYGGLEATIVNGVIFSACVMVISIYLMRLLLVITDWYASTIAVHTESTFDDELMPFVRRVGRTVIVIVGVMIILDHFNVDIKGMLAVLGVGSLAVALAAQETLSNMIAGFVIMVDRPFRRGDRIKLNDNLKCDVYEIGMRSTKFLTFDNTLVIVPNAELVKMTIENLTYPEPHIRVKVKVGVAYGSDVEFVSKILLEEAHKNPKVLKEPEPGAWFVNMADSALEFEVVGRVTSVTDQWPVSLELRQAIYKRLNAEGIEIPFPQRVVHLHNATQN